MSTLPLWAVVGLVVFWSALFGVAAVTQLRHQRQRRHTVSAYSPAAAELRRHTIEDPFLSRQPFGLGSGGGFG